MVLGRIVSFDEPISRDAGGPALMHVAVERTLAGEQQPSDTAVLTRVRQDGVPSICLEIDPRVYAGKIAVIAIHKRDDGQPFNGGVLDTWLVGTPFDGVGVKQLAALYRAKTGVAPGPPEAGNGISGGTEEPDRGSFALMAAVGVLFALGATSICCWCFLRRRSLGSSGWHVVILVLLLPMVGAASLASQHPGANLAVACTVTAGFDPVASSPLVVAGTITSVDPASDPDRDSRVITITVERVLKGELAGSTVQAVAIVNGPCSTFVPNGG